MILARNLLVLVCICYAFSKPVKIGGRRLIDVPSSCAEGTSLVQSGDCIRPFVLVVTTSNTTSTTTTSTTTSTTTEATTSTTENIPREDNTKHRTRHGHENRGHRNHH